MADLIISALTQWLWPLIVAGVGVLALLFHGWRKKAEGKREAQRQAAIAREAAAAKANIIREKARKTPIEKKRERTSKWEK